MRRSSNEAAVGVAASIFTAAGEGENFSSNDASFAAINTDDATVLYLVDFDYLNAVAESQRRQKGKFIC